MSGRELVGIAAHRLEEAARPTPRRGGRRPRCSRTSSTQRARGGVVRHERERRRLEQRERQRRLGTAGGGEHDAEAAVGVADEVGAVAHQLGDVVGVGEEVLADGGRALPVAAPVRHEEAEALVGQRPLGLPLLGAGGQRAVHEHDGRAVAPGLDVEASFGRCVHGSHRGSSSVDGDVGGADGVDVVVARAAAAAEHVDVRDGRAAARRSAGRGRRGRRRRAPSASSSSAWLIVEALARMPRMRCVQASPARRASAKCVGWAQLTM